VQGDAIARGLQKGMHTLVLSIPDRVAKELVS
jgi:hypothetical protein